MLKNVKREKIDRITELIFLIIEQQVLHLDRDVNAKFFFTTINIILITNHSTRLKKIRVIKKILDMKNYIINHLRLRRAVKKMFDFDKENDARNRSTVEKTNDHKKSEEEEEEKEMTDEQQKNKANEESEQKNEEKNEREQDATQYIDFVLSNFDDNVKDLNLNKNNKISFNTRESASLSASQLQSSIVLADSQSQTLLTDFQSQILQTSFQS